MFGGGTVGQIQYDARIDTSKLSTDAAKTESIISGTADRGSGSFLKMGAAIGVVSGLVSNVATKAMDALSSSIGDAVNRVDTLNNANRAFQNMGFTAGDTKKAMDALKTSILGLPTSLNAAVSNVELLASATNDIGKSQKIFAALNDGILGFGGTADQVNTAVIQLSQAFAGGRVMAQDWNSMLNAGLGPALNAIAKQMGVTTASLKSGLSDGSISVSKFQDALINLDQNGGGGLKSLQKIVKDSTSGIGTGMANMHTAIVRGLAAIIQAIGSSNISSAISGIGSFFEGSLKVVAKAITAVMPFFNDMTFVLGLLFQTLSGGDPTLTKSQMRFAGIAKALAMLEPAVETVHVFFRLLFDVLSGGDPTLQKGEGKFASLARWMAQLQPFVEGVHIAFRMLFDVLSGGDPTLQKGEGQFSGLALIFEKIRETIGTLIDDAVALGVGLYNALKPIAIDWLNDYVGLVKTIVTLVGTDIVDAWKAASGPIPVGKIVDGVRQIASGFEKITHAIVDLATTIFRALNPIVDWFGTNLLPFILKAAAVIGGELVTSWTMLTSAIKPLLPILKIIGVILGGAILVAIGAVVVGITVLALAASTLITVISVLINWAANLVNALVNGIGNAIANVIWWFVQFEVQAVNNFAAAYNFVTSVWSGIGGWFSGIVASIIGYFRGIPGAIGGLFSQALNTVMSIWSGIGSWFSGLGAQLVGAGRSMIDGLVNGISSGAGAVVNKIKDICSQSLDAVKKFFGIKSPSRVMMQMGGYLMQGFGKGMDQTSDIAISSAQRASNGVLSAFGNQTGVMTANVTANGSGGVSGGRSVNQQNTFNVFNNADADVISKKIAYGVL